MTKPKVLFVGCSHTADSGFTDENQRKFHWPWLLANRYNFYFYNAGIGGSSNSEIFYRTHELLLNSKFDLVIVMWSSLSRKWIYFNDNNVDDFTIINNATVQGLNASDKSARQYAGLHYKYFDNTYIDVKRWLIQCISLGNTLTLNQTDYVFIKGFDNCMHDIALANTDDFFVPDSLKSMLDFDNRPDDYIRHKVSELKLLTSNAGAMQWVNFDSDAFTSDSFYLDLADDNSHYGKESNLKFYKLLENYFNKHNTFN